MLQRGKENVLINTRGGEAGMKDENSQPPPKPFESLIEREQRNCRLVQLLPGLVLFLLGQPQLDILHLPCDSELKSLENKRLRLKEFQ